MPITPEAVKWLRFVRQYGPVARNDNMYDETIQRSASRVRIQPILFEHPYAERVLSCFLGERENQTSVVLTGTAGDGKTHLCRQVWSALGGSEREWGSNDPYLQLISAAAGRPKRVHFIRDLSGWAPQRGAEWPADRQDLLELFCQIVFGGEGDDLFLIAANDGQLVESWRRLPDHEHVIACRDLFETLLVEDRQQLDGTSLLLFNLSRGSSAELFDRALDAFLGHEGWRECYRGESGSEDAFGDRCPIRHNYELLSTPLVRMRLRELFELCDYNELHLPIRQILLLLTNAVLGHPDVKDRLLVAGDVPKILKAGTSAKASLYNNIFGGNLTDTRRETITVFDYLGRFRVGHETSNRIDNMLIFGADDDNFRSYFDALVGADAFYGADSTYMVAQTEYVEGGEEGEGRSKPFLDMLVSQRRGLFFKIAEADVDDLDLWELTVFKFAGEYLSRVVRVLSAGNQVERPVLARLVRGLNRIFVGMLVSSDRSVYVATSLSASSAKVSRILVDQISVMPRGQERVELVLDHGMPALNLVLGQHHSCRLPLHLVRYEFLSRVAEGVLPGSFSRECYEDILAFKSQVLSGIRARDGIRDSDDGPLMFRLLELDDTGTPTENPIEVARA